MSKRGFYFFQQLSFDLPECYIIKVGDTLYVGDHDLIREGDIKDGDLVEIEWAWMKEIKDGYKDYYKKIYRRFYKIKKVS